MTCQYWKCENKYTKQTLVPAKVQWPDGTETVQTFTAYLCEEHSK